VADLVSAAANQHGGGAPSRKGHFGRGVVSELPSVPDIAKKPILLVEDSIEDAALLQRVLQRVGVANRLFTVPSAEEAIAYLEGSGQYSDRWRFPLPGVLLLDLRLPAASGFSVLEWLKIQADLNDILILVLSGQEEVRNVSRAYALGARSFLMKPVNQEEIANMVKGFPGFWELPGSPGTPCG